MTFLPDNYKLPQNNTSGNYMKLTEGEHKFRILSSPLIGYIYFNTDDKPVRTKKHPGSPSDIRENEKIKEFWSIVVYDYSDKSLKILELTQTTIKKKMMDYINDEDYGDPRNYDFVITRTGSGIETEYSVIAKPPKEFTDTKALNKSKKINLNKLLEGGNPFENVDESDEYAEEEDEF